MQFFLPKNKFWFLFTPKSKGKEEEVLSLDGIKVYLISASNVCSFADQKFC